MVGWSVAVRRMGVRRVGVRRVGVRRVPVRVVAVRVVAVAAAGAVAINGTIAISAIRNAVGAAIIISVVAATLAVDAPRKNNEEEQQDPSTRPRRPFGRRDRAPRAVFGTSLAWVLQRVGVPHLGDSCRTNRAHGARCMG